MVYPFLVYSYKWNLSFSGCKGVWAGLVVVIACFAIFFSWQGLKGVKSLPKRVMLISIRVSVVVLIAFMVLQPVIELQKFEKLKSRIVVLVDSSMSMSIINSETNQSRASEVSQFIKNNSDYFGKLEKEFDVQYLAFSEDVQETTRTKIENKLQINGNRTDISGALSYVDENYGEGEVKACLLFSDGADNIDKDFAVSSKLNGFNKLTDQLHAPLYTFGPSSSSKVKDIAIKDIEYDNYAFVRNESKIRVVLKVNGFGSNRIPVTLKEGENLISSKLLNVVPGRDDYSVDFYVTPDKVGNNIYSASVPFYKDELIESNNLKEFSLSVIRDKVRILHLCGRPSWDLRFFRRMLKQVHNIDLISFYILKTSEDVSLVPNSEMSLIPFPIEELFTKALHSFDLVIFQNFDYRPFDMSGNLFKTYFANLKKYVMESGGAFLMVGGDLAFSEGGYEDTLVKDILPVQFGIDKAGISNDSFSARLTSQGHVHPVGIFDRDKVNNAEIWKTLPVLYGCNKIGTIKEDAVSIAEHPDIRVNEKNMPVIAAGNIGKGRSMAVMTDSLWKWDFMASAEGGTNRYYLTFWNNAIKWLTQDPAMNLVHIRTDKTDYKFGENVKVEIEALDSHYAPVKNGDINVNVVKAVDGSVVLSAPLKTDEKGGCSLDFEPMSAGFHKIEIEIDGVSDENSRNYSVFKVNSLNREFEDIEIKDSDLSGLADYSGGKFYKLPLNTNFKGQLRLEPVNRFQLLGKTKYSLWDNWVVFAVLVSAFGTEWWLRLKEGLT